MNKFAQSGFSVLAIGLFVLSSSQILSSQSNLTQIANGNFRIAGTVVNAISGQPLARARVSITDTHADVRNRESIQSVLTSEDGRFDLRVQAGKYALSAARKGFITAFYDQHGQFSSAIVTGTGLDTENLILRIAPYAVLFGKVIDENGEPIRHAQVTVYREDRLSGLSHIRPFRNALADDQGAYEIAPLDGGNYFISATATPWYAVHVASSQPGTDPSGKGVSSSNADRSLDVAYPTTYYADVTESDEATPIPVRGGDHIGVDIHLNPVPALRLLFHPPGNLETGFTMPTFQKQAFDRLENFQNSGAQMVSPGLFEITGIPAGKYKIHMPGVTDGQSEESADVDLTSDGQELRISSGEPNGGVKATVGLLGSDSLPPQINIALRNSKGKISSVAAPDAKGEVDFPNITPGKYDVLADSPTKAYSVAHMALQGTQISGHTLSVPSGSSLSVLLSLTSGSVTVEGFATRSGKPAPGVMVILVPKDPESNRELFRRDQSDLDGSFSLRSVIPGFYTIIAIEDAWEMDWAKPAVIGHYCARGQIVKINGQANGFLRLPNPVEVQSK